MPVFKPEIQNYIKVPFNITRLSDVALERLCMNVDSTLESAGDTMKPDFIEWLHSAKQVALEERTKRLIGYPPGYKEKANERSRFYLWDESIIREHFENQNNYES